MTHLEEFRSIAEVEDSDEKALVICDSAILRFYDSTSIYWYDSTILR
jgi:hypothetical protein